MRGKWHDMRCVVLAQHVVCGMAWIVASGMGLKCGLWHVMYVIWHGKYCGMWGMTFGMSISMTCGVCHFAWEVV